MVKMSQLKTFDALTENIPFLLEEGWCYYVGSVTDTQEKTVRLLFFQRPAHWQDDFSHVFSPRVMVTFTVDICNPLLWEEEIEFIIDLCGDVGPSNHGDIAASCAVKKGAEYSPKFQWSYNGSIKSLKGRMKDLTEGNLDWIVSNEPTDLYQFKVETEMIINKNYAGVDSTSFCTESLETGPVAGHVVDTLHVTDVKPLCSKIFSGEENFAVQVKKKYPAEFVCEICGWRRVDSDDGGISLHKNTCQHVSGGKHVSSGRMSSNITSNNPREDSWNLLDCVGKRNTHDMPSDLAHGKPPDLTYGEPHDLSHGKPRDPTHVEQSDVSHGESRDVTHGGSRDTALGKQRGPRLFKIEGIKNKSASIEACSVMEDGEVESVETMETLGCYQQDSAESPSVPIVEDDVESNKQLHQYTKVSLSKHDIKKCLAEAICQICSWKSPTGSMNSLNVHIWKSHGNGRVRSEEDVKCRECLKIFKNRLGLENHMRVTHLYAEVKCDQCLKTFKNKYSLNAHIYRLHGEGKAAWKVWYENTKKQNSISYCDQCSNTFTTPRGLKAHKLRIHEEKPKPPKKHEPESERTCSDCGKILKNRRSYLQHLKSGTYTLHSLEF